MSEISGVCLFLVTHLSHELTQAAYELLVWLTRASSAENPFEPSLVCIYVFEKMSI